ncbi:MAG: LamG domain-containing protein, partial [Planctomycetota bacterium]|jgi:hypothetical protein
LVGLEIIGPGEVAENFSARYKAIAHYDDDGTGDVTDSALWVVEPNTAANIDENGVLTTKDVVKDQPATILASYTEGDVTVEAEKVVDIFAVCPTGSALQFDGVDDYVEVPNTNGAFDLAIAWTLAAWVKPSVAATGYVDNPIIWKRTEGTTDDTFVLAWGSETGYGLENVFYTKLERASDGEDLSLHSDSHLPNHWHNVVAMYDGNSLKIYVNGTLENSRVIGTVVAYTGPGPLTIGSFIWYESPRIDWFEGTMDEVCIYNRALSAEEVQANMHRRLMGDELGLVGYWDFDEGQGQDACDLSGNGNDGTVVGATWVDSDAPIGICNPYLIATMEIERAIERKTALLEELLGALADEWAAYEALEELLGSGDYGDLNKGDIVKAKQKIHSATQHEEQSIDALEKSIEKLDDALNALGIE